ncbi:MAG TPA: transglycosylase SLT domain-containing protein [Bdellovibrionales bacterium]|nr:transglycosylase SLT domain-containing protein [Bdellovibrionales bacterium]
MLYVARILIAFTLLLAGCGKPRLQATGQDPYEPAVTGGTERNRPYTGYGPAPDLEEIKKHVPPSNSNRAFAAKIDSAQLLSHHGITETGALRIRMDWNGSDKPLEFWGQLKTQNGKTSAVLRDETGQQKGLVIDATCSDSGCGTVTSYMYFNRVLKSGMIFRKEERKIQARLAPEALKVLSCYDQTIQRSIQKYAAGVQVTVASTEVVPGATHFKLYENGDSNVRIEGKLLRTDGECLPLKGEGDEAILAQICLAGNSGNGSLVFKASLPPVPAGCKPTEGGAADPSIFLQVPRAADENTNAAGGGAKGSPNDGTTGAANGGAQGGVKAGGPAAKPVPVRNGGQGTHVPPPNRGRNEGRGRDSRANPGVVIPGPLCQLPIPPAQVHSLVKTIYKDCGHSAVAAQIAENWSARGNRAANLLRFLQQKDRGDVAVMKRVLRAASLPPVLSLITVQESDFKSNVCSPRGACGFWQLMPGTAAANGTPAHRRDETEPATRAAARYLNRLISLWTNRQSGEVNFKMVLASYNAGEGNAGDAAESLERRALRSHRAGEAQFARLTAAEIKSFSEDFWELYRHGMFTAETRKFVPSVLGLIFTSVRPDQAGHTGVEGFLDLD